MLVWLTARMGGDERAEWGAPEGGPAAFGRRAVLRAMALGVGAALAGPLVAACDSGGQEQQATPSASPSAGAAGGGGGGGGGVVWLSTQLAPAEESATVRNVLLEGLDRSVTFLPADESSFLSRIRAQQQTGSGSIDAVGALHGTMGTLQSQDALVDLRDRFEEISDRGFTQNYLDLASFDGDGLYYVPWMQATYLMVAHRDALAHVPDGVQVSSLTYDQLTGWSERLLDETSQRLLGFPAGGNGLFHRFLQGYLYPSFTGALNTAFASAEAEEGWRWLQQTWEYAHPESTLYGFMQEPLRLGEVQLAWDHTARLKEALQSNPDQYEAFPAPTGPKGLGFMPVVAGLGIPKSASNPDAAWELIKHMTTQETMAQTLQETGFLPPLEQDLDVELDAGLRKMVDAVAAQTSSDEAVLSLLPTGLGTHEGIYTKAFYDTFRRIVLEGGDIAEALELEGPEVQAVLERAEASCWRPDPTSSGICQVS